MKNLLTALFSKFSGSDIWNDVGGRVYLEQAPEGTEFPYIVFSIASNAPDWTFTEDFEDTIIQFSLFSSSTSGVEITTMYADLIALFDDCSLSITSNTFIYMHRQNLTTMIEELTTTEGTSNVRHWAVDYNIYIQAT